MREELRPRGRLDVAELAGAQHGVVSHAQLERVGLSPAAIGRDVAAGRLLGIDRGVYAVGHDAISDQGRCLAAVLGCGRGAVVSHTSAGWLLGLLGRLDHPPEVTLPRRGHRKASARIHHSTKLTTQDLTVCDAIPSTALPRTLLDLAATLSTRALESSLERAERVGMLDLIAIDELMARCGAHQGRRPLERALGIYRDPVFSRSRYERLFLALVKTAGLPPPAINIFVAGHEIDAYWERERFVVEINGWDTHRTRAAFERDPLRQQELSLSGIESIRITARRIEREPQAVAQALGRLLERRRHLLEATGHR